MKLAQKSLEAFADEAAIAAARVVLDFAEDNPIVSADARSILCEACCLGGDIDRAAEEIAAAVRHLESSKDRRRLLAAMSKAADVAWQGRRIEETRRWIDRALPVARELDDWIMVARLASLGATIANLRGDQESGVRYAAEAPLPEKTENGRHPSGGIIHVPMIYPIASLDPATTGDPWHTHLVNSVFETLTRTTERGVVAPWLAQHFDLQDGGRSVRFVLRDDVTFHDGRPLTARDIRYSFERVLRRGGPWTEGLLDAIRGATDVITRKSLELAGIRIVNDRELVVEMSNPVPFLPAVLTFTSFAIVPEGTEEVGHSMRNGCVGTGPFRVTRFEPGRWVELERNPHYWRPGRPNADGLVAWLGVRPDDIAPRFRSGRLSIAYDLPPADFHALRHDSGLRAKFSEAPVLSTCFLAFNMHSPALSDRTARERIAASLADIASVVRSAEPHVTPATSVFPPGMLGHDPQPRSRPKRPLQRTSGMRVPLSVGIYSVWSRVYSALARECLDRFRDAGFDPTVDEKKRMLLWDDAHDVDVVLTRWVYDYPDSDSFARSVLESMTGMVGWACGSPELDQLVQRGRTERNRQVRNEIYGDIDEHLAREALLIPLFHEQTYCFARPEVDGLNVRPFFPFVPFEDLAIKS
jgi:ABC-type transport system substrate-binding protein